VRLVAGLEVEDPAAAALVAAAAAEDLAALEPADQHEAVGGRDVERLAVHLLLLDHEGFAEPLRDRVRPIDHPQPLALAGFAPGQVAGRAHQPLEDLREVSRVQDDKAHPVEHAPVDPLDGRVRDLAVRDVAPPREDVGGSKDVVGKAVLGFVERGRADVETGVAQALGERAVDAVGVHGADDRVGAFLAVLVPDGDAGH